MEKKAVIFDLDGVLIHTDEYHYESWKVIADKLGIPFNKTNNNKLRGLSRIDSLDMILGSMANKFSDIQKKSLTHEKNSIYVKKLQNMSPKSVKDEVWETLDRLKEKGIRLAIGSSSKNATMILEKTGLIKYFDIIVDGNDILKSKPDPEVFIKAAEKLKLEPFQCIVVEDAEAGIIAASDGGFDTIGIGDAAGYERTTWPIERFSDVGMYIIDNRTDVGKTE